VSIDPRREAVLDELRLHRPADELEAEHLARAIAVTEGTTNPFDRSGFSPGHLTASGFVVDTSGTRVLLIHHGIIDAWLQPGGHVDPEDPDAVSGALREIAEETGVTALTRIGEGLLDVDVHHHPGKPGREPPHIHLDIRYGFRASDDRLVPTAEVRDARWVDPADLAALNANESVARPVRTLMGLVGPPPS